MAWAVACSAIGRFALDRRSWVPVAADALDLLLAAPAHPTDPSDRSELVGVLRSLPRLAEGRSVAAGIEAMLQAHRDRWRDHGQDWRGWVAWAPLALGCLAVDRGVDLDLDQRGLPAFILTGDAVRDADLRRR